MAKTPEPKPVVTPAPAMNSPATTAATVDRSATTHTVGPGQTYYSISKQYGLTVDELMTLNSLTDNDVLEVGKKLKVKATPGSQSAGSVSTKPAAGTKATVSYHTIAKGETMYRVSQQYGVSIEQIKEWNNLKDTGVQLGQKIKIIKNE